MISSSLCAVFCATSLALLTISSTETEQYTQMSRFCEQGKCTRIWNCPYYKNLLQMNPRPPNLTKKIRKNYCGLSSFKTPKVCCLNEQEMEQDGIRSHQNFRLLPMDSCGPISHGTRIVEGATVSPGEFPWMALIAYEAGDSRYDQQFKCGGSLINEKYVLTAAHCLHEKNILGIRLGEYDISTELDCDVRGYNCEPPVQDVLISKIIIHDRYNPSTLINDIGLIRLKTLANVSQANIKPICLPHGPLLKANLIGKFLTVTGWGTTETGHGSMVLNKVSIPVVPLKECKKLVGEAKPLFKTQTCAGGYKGRDSCSGDSGGPLQYIASMGHTQRYVQDGVVSYGSTQCGIDGRPAIYTNVKEYMSWILDNIEP